MEPNGHDPFKMVEIVSNRTMTWNKEGPEQEDLLGFRITFSLAALSEAG